MDKELKTSVNKADILNELEKYRKNMDALFDISGLVHVLRSGLPSNGIEFAGYFRRVLRDLEDPDVWISYKGNFHLNHQKLVHEATRLEKTYGNVLTEKDFSVLYEDYDIPLFRSNNCNYEKIRENAYNLIVTLSNHGNFKSLQELFASNISQYKRVEMMNDFLLQPNLGRCKNILSKDFCPHSVHSCKLLHPDAEEKHFARIQDLLLIWKEDKRDDGISTFAESVIGNPGFPTLEFFSENHLIDFNLDCHFFSEGKPVGTPYALYLTSNRNFDMMEMIYEQPSYLEIPEEARNRTDELLIQFMDFVDLKKLVALRNFQLSESKVERLANAIMEFPLRKTMLLTDCVDQFKSEIERKAQTPEELVEMEGYSALLQQKVDLKIDESRLQFTSGLSDLQKKVSIKNCSPQVKIKQLKFLHPSMKETSIKKN